MAARVWGLVLFTTAVLGSVTCVEPARVCSVPSVSDSVLGARDPSCPIDLDVSIGYIGGVGGVEENEASFQRALSMVNKKSRDYVALLLYASWCPFSASFRPKMTILSSLYPSIPHFAIEESAIRPSILSKYRVHGFPTLFLLNSTMRFRYHGSRTLGSLVAFYNDVTGLKSASLDSTSLEKIISSSYNNNVQSTNEPESYPFSWAKSPENFLRQETYLALAASFVLVRLLYFLYPTLSAISQLFWTCYIQNITLLEHPRNYLYRALHLFNYLKELRKRRDLKEGAMSAKAWASK